jgi:capsular exopolysaccharide synthesis family protein
MKEDINIWESKKTTLPVESSKTSVNAGAQIDLDFKRLLSIWPYILLFGFLGFLAGSLYLRYVSNVYNVSTSIIIEEKEELALGQNIFGPQRDPFNDKIAYLKSPTLSYKLVDSLGLQYRAEAKGRLKDRNFYSLIKWFIISNSAEEDPEINFTIDAAENDFEYKSGSAQGRVKWGQPFDLNGHKVVVYKLHEFESQAPIFCYSKNRLAAAFELSRRINISSNKESNILHINYSDVSSERAIDVLNGLVALYNNVLSNEKTQSFSQAIDFIDSRLEPLGRELDSIENSLAQFKSSKGFVGVSANGELILEKLREYDKQKNEIDILRETISSIEQFIKNPNLKEEDISFVGITDPGLQSTLKVYQETRRQRDLLSRSHTDQSPTLKLVDEQVEQLKGNMNLQLDNYKNNLRLAEDKYNTNIREADKMLRATPMDEKQLISRFRLRNIKETLFLSLLEKKEEASIQRASVTVNSKVISPPAKISASIKPSRSSVLLISVAVGLLIPLLFFVLVELLNNKVISKKQLQGMTNIPVIAELEHVDGVFESSFIVSEAKRSMFGEQIRSLRTNIDFYNFEGRKCKYVLLTSSVSGEGKSFISMNLAKSYSLQGKKVALLEFDLRRPKISSSLKIPKDKNGLSMCLIGKLPYEKIPINVSNEHENGVLDLFPAGAIPPNPQELISGPFIQGLKDYLDANYDVVIIDTPPFGIVADAQILGKWADVTLIVTRYKQTIKDQITEINEWYERDLFKHMALVLNGVKNKGYFGSKYGNYYYKRKYGYTYYSSSEKGKDA